MSAIAVLFLASELTVSPLNFQQVCGTSSFVEVTPSTKLQVLSQVLLNEDLRTIPMTIQKVKHPHVSADQTQDSFQRPPSSLSFPC
jgi:hypothetical protein